VCVCSVSAGFTDDEIHPQTGDRHSYEIATSLVCKMLSSPVSVTVSNSAGLYMVSMVMVSNVDKASRPRPGPRTEMLSLRTTKDQQQG